MISTNRYHNKINITLNSIVLDFCNLSKKINQKYSKEIVSLDDYIKTVFNFKPHFIGKNIFEYFINFIDTKIFLGERIILKDVSLLSENYLKKILLYFCEKKNNIYSIIDNNTDKKHVSLIRDFTTIIKEKENEINFCKRIEFDDKTIEKNYQGITVVGDLHGEKEKLVNVVDWASRNNNFIVFLGDIVNYGPNSIECVEIIYELIIRNKALLVLGNHERKLFKYMNNESVFFNEACKKTLEKIFFMREKERKSWCMKFNTLINNGKIFFRYKNAYFCHGGFTNNLINYNDDLEINSNRIKNICMFGDPDIFKEKNYHKKNFSNILKSQWLTNLPENILVFLGHRTVDDKYPFVFNSKNNTKVYFIDTGSGKGGTLTSVDLRITSEDVVFKNFNLW